MLERSEGYRETTVERGPTVCLLETGSQELRVKGSLLIVLSQQRDG